jgi:copper oxidase (laccase) domain-containing protein
VIDLGPALRARGVRCVASARPDGSLGFTGAPDRDAIRAARVRLLGAAGLDAAACAGIRQVHGAAAFLVREPGRGGLDPSCSPGEGDILATDRAGIPLLVLGADCVIGALAAADGRAVAAFHAGWRGAAAGAPAAAVAALEGLGVPAGEQRAALGPCIGPCCYEVGPEVAAAFAGAPGGADLLRPGPRGRPHLDLPGAVREALVASGVPREAVASPPGCTACEPGRWFSHRRGDAGRQGLVVAITGGLPASVA